MVMQDKLIKNNHKGIYYKAKRAMIGALVVLGLSCSVAIPTYISIHKDDETISTKAEETVDQNSEEETLEY